MSIPGLGMLWESHGWPASEGGLGMNQENQEGTDQHSWGRENREGEGKQSGLGEDMAKKASCWEVMLSCGQCHWIKRPGKYFAETTVGTCTSKCCFHVPTKLPPVLWEYVTSSNHTASLKLKMVPRVGCDLKPPFLGAYTISPAQGSVGYRTSGSGVWHPAYPESAGRMCLLLVFWVLAHHPVNLGSEDGRTTKNFTCIRQDHCMYLVGGPDPSLWCRPHLLPHFDGTQGERSSYLPVMCCTPRSLPCLELTWLEGPALQLWGVCDAPGRPVHGAAVGKGGWSQPWLELSH